MRLLDRKELAYAIKEHPQTIHKKTVNNQIPHYRNGNCIRYSLDEVLDHMRVDCG
jgi:hypothetical protein